MEKIIKSVGRVCCWLFCLLSFSVVAIPPAPTGESAWYYEIGGARAITAPANPTVTTITLGGSAQLGLGYSCGNFDPVLGVTNILNQISSGAEAAVNQMVSAAYAAIGSLPALILQRANPGLYDLFQNALIKAETSISLATQSCEQMEAEIAQGGNPFEEWITLSKGNDWKVLMGTGGLYSAGGDVKTAEETVANNNGKNGIPWLGGSNAGGQGQAPIRIVEDTVRAGFNITLNRPAHSGGSVPSGPTDPLLAQTWNSPALAAQWAVDVLGDTHVRTYRNRPTESTPGHGLLPKIDDEQTIVEGRLTDLVKGTTPSTLSNLNDVSAPGTLLTRQVVEAIRELPPTEQSVVIAKLAAESATARILEKAMLLRRLLLTGMREPNITASPAQEEIARSVTELDREIDNVLFETRIRRELFANTSNRVLTIEQLRKTHGISMPPAKPNDQNPIAEGAVAP